MFLKSDIIIFNEIGKWKRKQKRCTHSLMKSLKGSVHAAIFFKVGGGFLEFNMKKT